MSPNPLVSVLMPTKNRPRFVARQVEIFRAQDYPRKQLVILDDSEGDPRLYSSADIKHARFKGATRVIEKIRTGLSLAHGELICFLDDDDWSAPNRLTQQVQPFFSTNCRMNGIPRDYIVRIPEMTWHKFIPKLQAKPWAEGPSPKWPGLPFLDGTAMFDRKAVACAHQPFAGNKIEFLQRIRAAVPTRRVANVGLFVYVWHCDNLWLNDQAHLMERVDAPSFVSADQIKFWEAEAFIAEVQHG